MFSVSSPSSISETDNLPFQKNLLVEMIMPQPKVSIIVPVYNVEKYIDRCMQSLLNQTLYDIEIILVDDGSPDNCPAMCNDYAEKDSRIKVIHKKNAGLGFARNSGIDIATGEYLAFLDSDDYVEVTMYEKLYEKALTDNLDACYCDIRNFDDHRILANTILLSKNDKFYNREDVDNLACHMLAAPISDPEDVEVPNTAWNGIYRKNLIEKYVMRFRSEREFVSEDVMFHADYLKYFNRIGWIREPLVCHYISNISSLTHSFSMTKCAAILGMAQTLLRVIPINYSDVNYLPCLHGYLLNSFGNTIFNISKMDVAIKLRFQNISNFVQKFYDVMNNKQFISPPGRRKIFFYCYNKKYISILSLFYILRNGIIAKTYHKIKNS